MQRDAGMVVGTGKRGAEGQDGAGVEREQRRGGAAVERGAG